MRKAVAVLVVVLAIMVVAVDYVIEFMWVDSCLDRGGAFNYVAMECSTDPNGPTTFPFVPYRVRNLSFLAVVGSSAVLLVLGFLFIGNKGGDQ